MKLLKYMHQVSISKSENSTRNIIKAGRNRRCTYLAWQKQRSCIIFPCDSIYVLEQTQVFSVFDFLTPILPPYQRKQKKAEPGTNTGTVSRTSFLSQLKTTHHVWGGVEKKALPLTCASQSAQPRKCWTNKGETVRQARTMRGNPHVPLYAGTRSWVAEPEREKRHQPGKTQPAACDHDHESKETKK